MVDRSSAPFHEAGILCLDVHADGQACLTGGEDGAVFVSNLATGRPLGSLAGGHEDTVETAGFCPLLPIAATGDVTGARRHAVLWEGAWRCLAVFPTWRSLFAACREVVPVGHGQHADARRLRASGGEGRRTAALAPERAPGRHGVRRQVCRMVWLCVTSPSGGVR